MYLIENTIKNGILTDIYNIISKKKYTSNDFTNFLNELIVICENNHQTLENYIKNNVYMENGDTIIHYIVKNILFIPIYYPANNIIAFNNRNDINLNDNLYIDLFIPHYKKKHTNDLLKFTYNNYDYTQNLMYFLFILLSKIDNSILLLPDTYGNTILELLIQHKYKFYRKGNNYGSLLLLLTYGEKIIILQQSYVRRYLAKRRIIKIKKQKVFDTILYAPAGHIEYYTYRFFQGGYAYIQANEKFNKIKVR